MTIPFLRPGDVVEARAYRPDYPVWFDVFNVPAGPNQTRSRCLRIDPSTALLVVACQKQFVLVIASGTGTVGWFRPDDLDGVVYLVNVTIPGKKKR